MHTATAPITPGSANFAQAADGQPGTPRAELDRALADLDAHKEE